MITRPIGDCISDTTDVVVNLMCDTRFHQEVLGLSPELSRRLTGARVSVIRESVASVFGSSIEPPLDHDERVRLMAYRLQDSMRTFRAIERLPQPKDKDAEFEECMNSVLSVFKPTKKPPLAEPVEWFTL